jgi:hypothetical protein
MVRMGEWLEKHLVSSAVHHGLSSLDFSFGRWNAQVVSAFKEGGWSFLKRCFNEPDFLESLSGLKAIKDATDAAMDDLDWDEDEDDDDM